MSEKERQTEELREKFDFLQSKAAILNPVLGKGYLMDKLKVNRHVVTVGGRDMPKVNEIYAKWSHPVFEVGNLIKNIEFPSSYRELCIQQLKDLLEFPERFKKSAPQRNNKEPKIKDHIRSHLLRVRQNALGEPNPLIQTQVTVTEKEVTRVHKRYVKAFKEDDLIDHKRFVEDDEIRRNKR